MHLIPEDFVGYSPDYFKNNSGFSEPILTLTKTKAKPYVDQFPNMFIMPKVMMDYGTLKPGFYFYSSEVINRLSVFGGASLNKLNDVDLSKAKLCKTTLSNGKIDNNKSVFNLNI